MTLSPKTKLLKLSEVAERLGMSLSTIRKWAAQRRLPIIKLGHRVRMRERDLEKLIESSSRPTTKEVA